MSTSLLRFSRDAQGVPGGETWMPPCTDGELDVL